MGVVSVRIPDEYLTALANHNANPAEIAKVAIEHQAKRLLYDQTMARLAKLRSKQLPSDKTSVEMIREDRDSH